MIKHYGWIINICVTLLAAYFSAKIANVYIVSLLETPRSIALVSKSAGGAPLPTVIAKLDDYKPVIERNIFDATIVAPTPVPCAPDDTRPECAVPTPTPCTPGDPRPECAAPGDAVKTTLSLKVLSTLAVAEGKDSRSNSMISGGKEPEVWVVGAKSESFASAQLVQVKPRRIEFLNNGRLEYAELEDAKMAALTKGDNAATPTPSPSASGVPTGDQVEQDGNKFTIAQAELDAALSNLDQLYTQIRVVPNFDKDGKADGMKILTVKPGSVFSKLGLRRGDVLHRINGQELDIKNGFQMFTQLREQKHFSVDLERGTKAESYDYDVQ